MKPFHLQIRLDPATGALICQWFGSSAIHAAGSSQHAIRPAAGTKLVPDPYLIDLQPLLAEVAAGTIASAEALANADEFLLLRDLLEPDDFETLADTLFRFLYQTSQSAEALESVRSVVAVPTQPVDHQRVDIREPRSLH